MHISAINLIMLCVPKKMIGASVSVAIYLKYIGAAASPAICGIYMGIHLSSVFTNSNINPNGILQLFPSSESYQFVFLYCTTIVIIIIFIAIIANKLSPKCQNYSSEERGEIGNIANKFINEIQRWEGIEIKPHAFGGFQFKIDGIDIGHIHGDKIVDLPPLFTYPTKDFFIK
ncbi:hypothetical protein [Candidatus Nitrosocosmicus sp. R]